MNRLIMSALLIVCAVATANAGLFDYIGAGALTQTRGLVTYVDNNSDNIVNQGDVVQIVQDFSTNAGETLLGITAMEVASITVDNVLGTSTYNFTAPTAGNDLSSILTAASISTAAGMTDVNAGATNTFALIRSTTADYSLNGSVGSGGLGLNGSLASLGLDAAGATWSVDLLAGFDGSDDFYQWYASSTTLESDARFAGLTANSSLREVGFALTVNSYRGDGYQMYLGNDSVTLAGTTGSGSLTSSSPLGTLRTLSGTDNGSFSGAYGAVNIQTLSSVPEPSSLAVLLGFGVVGFVRGRRRAN